MPKRSSKKDFAQNALRVVEQATGGTLKEEKIKLVPKKAKGKPKKG